MANSLSISSSPTLQHETTQRRLIFNGDAKAQPASRTNKQVKKHRLSPPIMIATVLSVALIAVFFIWNKIGVNRLASEIDAMQLEYQNIVGKNEILRSEVSQKSRPERIEVLAQSQMGLMFRKEQPVLFQMDR